MMNDPFISCSLSFSKSKHQNTQYKCDQCNKTFSRASNVARHIDTIHNLSKTFPCKWCGKEFRSTGGRDMHVSADHKAVRYSCSICGKQFKRKGSLGRHLAGSHGQGRLEMFKCQVSATLLKIGIFVCIPNPTQGSPHSLLSHFPDFWETFLFFQQLGEILPNKSIIFLV